MDNHNFGGHHRHQSSGDGGLVGFNSSGRNALLPRDQVIDVLKNLNVSVNKSNISSDS